MAYDTAGDPMGGLKWTHRTTEKISEHLGQAGIEASPRTVARLLETQGYSLRVNHKKRSTVSNEHRNEQFEYIQTMRQRFQKQACPVVSVDSKKKEMIGDFKSAGAAWSQQPVLVNDHDFKRDAEGIALPRGTYDLAANRGHVCVGISHDTSAFAVDALRCWWKEEGRRRYPQACQMLLLADSGGSNNCRHWGWKHNLQIKFCDAFGITLTVCHYPPGSSKWNPIEHRLFSEISKNCAGRPLDTYETLLNHIATTQTKTGLRVRSCLLQGFYPLKQKVSKEARATINIQPHRILPQWNYTIRPSSTKR